MSDAALGKAAIPANTDYVLYTVPTGRIVTFSLNIANRTADPIPVTVSIGAAVPTDADVFEPQASIKARDVLERTGVIAFPGEKVVVRAPSVGLTARLYGFTEKEVIVDLLEGGA